MMRIFLASLAVIFSCTNLSLAAEQNPNAIPATPVQTPASDETVMHPTYSLRACFDQADINNKEIALASSNLSIARAGVVIAKAIPNPTFNFAYGFGPAWRYVIAGNNQQFGWNEEIQVAGRRTKKTDLAQANYMQTALEIEAVRFDVHNRVRRAYAELAMASAFLRLSQLQQATTQKLLDIAQKRFAAGKASGAEVFQAQLNVMQVVVQCTQAWGRLVQDSAKMNFLLGQASPNEEIFTVDSIPLYNILSGRSGITPDPDKGIPTLGQLLPTAWQRRPDLRAAIQQAYADRKALTLSKTQRIPDPFVGFNYLFSTYKTFQTQFFNPAGNGLNVPENQVPYQPGYMVTVAEECPIFYQYQGEVAQAKATWIQQLKQNDQLRSQVAADIVTAYEALVTSIKNLRKCQEELLPEAMQASHLSYRSYQMGKTDLATAILAQQQYGQLVATYFDSAVSYQNAWADLEKAVGIPLNL
jgi:outer membrane protein, heavy metal efflux system